jgi:acetyltransferase-like isoleucine patch superfamily enzyme
MSDKILTQDDISAWPVVHGRKTFPEYTQFGNSCSFSVDCHFGHFCVFGEQCYFGGKCTFGGGCGFGSSCGFSEGCTFGGGCRFSGSCRFGGACTFGGGCSFGNSCNFSGSCRFNGAARFGGDCSFGRECVFSPRCRFGWDSIFGESCVFEGHKARKENPFITCAGLGSIGRTTYFFDTVDGIYVRCGCFLGTLDEFRAKVKGDDGQYPLCPSIKTLQYLGFANIAAVTFGGEVQQVF